ncbi:MAG: copper transporter [Actinomycetota bacterium]
MLSPRYHLVSIVAIFLALGLGLLAGSSFGQPTLVGQLQERTEAQLRRIEELRDEVDVERARADALAAYANASAPILLAGRLAGSRVVVVTQEGVPSELETSVLEALDVAGARVLVTLAAQPSLTGADPTDAVALGALLGPSGADGATPWPTRAGALLAQRFAAPLAPIDAAGDLLVGLLDGGFLAARDGSLDDETRSEIHAAGFLVVVLGGTDADAPPLATRPFVEALVAGLADAGVPVGAAETSAAGDPWVGDVPTDTAITVVGAEAPPGAVALVLGLLDAAAPGEGGAYGGDRAPLPTIP